MVSFATKLSIFTMFSTMAAAATETQDVGTGSLIDRTVLALKAELAALKFAQNAHNMRLTNVGNSLTEMDSKQITGDYFHTNENAIEFTVNGDRSIAQLLYTFTVDSDEVLDFMANVTSDHNGENNMLSLYLTRDGQSVSYSVDDGNGGDDNASLSLLYKEKMASSATFHVWARAYTENMRVLPNQLQISYKTYGNGHDLILL